MMSATSAPLLDDDKLHDLARALQPKDFTMLLQLFAPQADSAMAQFDAANAAGNALGCRNALHGLKGMAGNIGVMRVAELAMQMEVSGRYDALPELRGLIEDSKAALATWRPPAG